MIGIYPDMPIDVYHKHEGISSTGINLIRDCPKRYWHERLSGYPRPVDSKAFIIGSAFHTLVLEPDEFDKRYIVLPSDLNRRTKEGKIAFATAEATGKIFLRNDEFENINNMAKSAMDNKEFSSLIDNGNIEDSLFLKDQNGTTLKSRPDFYNDYMVIDLKTTDSAKPSIFMKKIGDFGYHRQAAMALDLLSELTGKKYEYFVIMAVEKNPPYLTAMYVIDKIAIDLGRREYLESVEVYRECMTNDYWPGYQDDIQEICLPQWYK